MDTDYDVWTPTFENLCAITDAAFMKEFARLGAKAIDHPIQILHPVLAIAQQPVVETDQLCRDLVRLFHGFNDAHRIRLTLEKLLDTGNDRSRSRAMAAAGVRRHDRDFRVALHVLIFPRWASLLQFDSGALFQFFYLFGDNLLCEI